MRGGKGGTKELTENVEKMKEQEIVAKFSAGGGDE